jgi:hypothetical protein
MPSQDHDNDRSLNSEILNDIINGYSKYLIDSENIVYFQHLNLSSYHRFSQCYADILKGVEKFGVASEQEQIENACKNGWWSNQKENEIQSIKKFLERLFKTRAKLVYKKDKDRIDEQLNEQQAILEKLQKEKDSYISITSEGFALRKTSDFYIKNFIYKDENLKIKFFETNNDFEYAEDEIIDTLNLIYYNYLDKLSTKNIRKLALSHEFQNLLFIADTSNDLFGQCIVNLTKNQIDLMIWGKYFKNIIQNTTKDIPEGLMDDPDKFIEWVENIKSQNNKPQNSKKTNKKSKKDTSSSSFLFGSSDEIKSMTGEEISGNRIIKESSEKGGLNMQDLMNK